MADNNLVKGGAFLVAACGLALVGLALTFGIITAAMVLTGIGVLLGITFINAGLRSGSDDRSSPR
ncbi:hypothetical protein [Verrucosispora sp. FIM060022]|uniref:hypothetical protein n=1 Tax=Verrucosispora sp. FIM060022 TaxID=1479020 RepID=UPI000F896C82|nr:hypothetical protein [Verrucosispora sp. FIM060022]RUL93754.1 hypothetical protein EG812_08670 [Verrucosispora sp. FIM060022]